MTQFKLDKLDYKILDTLQHHAKITNARLSQEVGLSAAPTLERVKKLEQNGYIKGYYAALAPAKLEAGLCAFVLVKLKAHNKQVLVNFEHEVLNIDNILECHQVSGLTDFIVKIRVKDLASYQQLFIEKLSTITQVDTINSMVVFNSIKEEQTLPIQKF